MKKGMITILITLLLFSTTAYAITYGGQITRITTFPGEKTQADFAKETIAAQTAATAATIDQTVITNQKIKDLQDSIIQLQTGIDKVSADANNARTETNVQLSNIINSINGIKTQLDSINDLKTLKTDLPPLIEQPRQIITPQILLNLSAVNIFLLIILIALVLFVKKDHEASHKMTPHGHPELHEYIKQHITKGVNINMIRHQLIAHDWDEAEVDQAIREVKES